RSGALTAKLASSNAAAKLSTPISINDITRSAENKCPHSATGSSLNKGGSILRLSRYYLLNWEDHARPALPIKRDVPEPDARLVLPAPEMFLNREQTRQRKSPGVRQGVRKEQ